ncbi:hypothetical protein B0H10DRAFT_2210592 [Mycena sp. CBHHK59/15]|nr:hypothetical protein B0H10DRAFT_2210592 [Mycena sp. CBHHK59/15]
MPARRPRRVVAIDHGDGEPFTRADIQFDLLSCIFSDETKAFTDPRNGAKLSFRDLYVNAILRSPKVKAVLKEKLSVPTFATDFAMLALLTNVGRIAMTMSFFAEMRTVQRTYHPIPSLQRTDGNLLDAPRIKHILKTTVLEGETKNIVATPAQVFARAKAGQIPPTTLPNLIFVLANHSVQIGRDHLSGMEFLDLFLPNDASSESRARAFLWLCYRYHEGPSAGPDDDYDGDAAGLNPFSDPGSPGKMPRLVILTPGKVAVENLDSEEEKALASRLVAQRETVMRDHLLKESFKESKAKALPDGESPAKAKSKRGGANAKAGPSTPSKRKAQTSRGPGNYIKEEADLEREGHYLKSLDLMNANEPIDSDSDVTSNFLDASTPLRPIYPLLHRAPATPSPRPFPFPPPDPHSSRYSPYKRSPVHSKASQLRAAAVRNRPRTMVQHAWHVITTSDPLDDSDEEAGDEHVRRDHAQRLDVLSRLRGKAPTPEPEGFRQIPIRHGLWHED